MNVSSSQSPYGAKEFLAVGLVINADPFPPVFFVVQLHCCPVCVRDERWCCIAWEASELPILIIFEECDVLVFELDRLFCVVVCPLYCVLADAQEVIESNKR